MHNKIIATNKKNIVDKLYNEGNMYQIPTVEMCREMGSDQFLYHFIANELSGLDCYFNIEKSYEHEIDALKAIKILKEACRIVAQVSMEEPG